LRFRPSAEARSPALLGSLDASGKSAIATRAWFLPGPEAAATIG